MDEKKEEELLRGLNTMLPIQLHEELTLYCKENADSFGKWSYAIGFRQLLRASKILESLCNLEGRVTALEIIVNEKPEEKTKKPKGVKVLGEEGEING